MESNSNSKAEEEPKTSSISSSDSFTRLKVEIYYSAREPIEPFTNQNGPAKDWNPWTPFQSVYNFKLACWFIESEIPKTGIDRFFNMSLVANNSTFLSGHILHKLISSMEIDMRENSQLMQKMKFYNSIEILYY